MTRKPNGQFDSGNPGGPGRPPRQQEADYLRATMDECPVDEWRAIVRKAVTSAKKGDGYARKFLADYLLPRPVMALDISLNDQRQLAEVIDALRAAGMEPSAIFARMIAQARARAGVNNDEP